MPGQARMCFSSRVGGRVVIGNSYKTTRLATKEHGSGGMEFHVFFIGASAAVLNEGGGCLCMAGQRRDIVSATQAFSL